MTFFKSARLLTEIFSHQVNRLGSEILDFEEFQEGIGNSVKRLPVFLHLAGLKILVDLGRDAAADAVDFLKPLSTGDGLDVFAQVLKHPGGLAVSQNLERGFSLDLEGVGNPGKERGQLPIFHFLGLR
jgi:hypothetical protein